MDGCWVAIVTSGCFAWRCAADLNRHAIKELFNCILHTKNSAIGTARITLIRGLAVFRETRAEGRSYDR